MNFKSPFVFQNYAKLVERILLHKNHQCPAPQLFITGLPRSGTTLIYQYIVHRLRVSYFTHGVGKFPYAPCCTTFVQHRLHGQYRSEFKSNYGKESGAVSPREAGRWWCRYFDINNYVNIAGIPEKDIRVMRNTIACIQNIFTGVPFVNKNVKHLLRIGALSEIFPNSAFLIVDRDVSDVAVSILRGRYDNLSDPTQWWSVRPPNYDELKELPIIEQVANQCVSLKQKMRRDLSKIPSERILRIDYRDFCNDPEALVQNIISSINVSETENDKRRCFTIPRRLQLSQEELSLLDLVGKLESECSEEIL